MAPPNPTGILQKPLVTFYFCRHGETDLNIQGLMQGSGVDAPLNDLGRRQAHYLGQRFRDIPVDWVITSGLARAQQTAKEVLHHHPQCRYTEDPRLNEICWGEWEGKPTSICSPVLARWNAGDYEAKSEGAESAVEAGMRALQAMDDVMKEIGSSQHVVLVLHGRLLRIILSLLINRNLDFMNYYPHKNTSVNVVSAYKKEALTEAEVACLNDELKLFEKANTPVPSPMLTHANTEHFTKESPTPADQVLDKAVRYSSDYYVNNFLFRPILLNSLDHLPW
ncbi:hypothetical protein IWQ62_004200 [Dispira parvispora]|uniref:Uncharacterized protein n=1 Tax=Dispira parvispora TaxID=1520584 RepID=A0A9W8E5U4_9FUNG|nr:hypothetical protein IWQ62_004200 [Dispira parvispora]